MSTPSNQSFDVAIFYNGQWVNLRQVLDNNVPYPSGITFFPPNYAAGHNYWAVYQ